MGMLSVIGAVGAFFYTVAMRIICIIRGCYVKCRAHVRGGVEYWRGGVVGGGIEKQRIRWRYFKKYASKHGLAFGEVPAALRLLVGLPTHAKGGGASGGDSVADFQQVKEVLHGAGLPVHRARRRVVVSPSWARFSLPTCLRQRVVDGSAKGQSVFFMPL